MQLDKILGMDGWQSLEEIAVTEMDEEQKALALEFASYYRQIFETDAGKRVLEHLIKMTLLQPTVQPMDSQFAAGIREGRADMVRSIMRQIEFAKTGE